MRNLTDGQAKAIERVRQYKQTHPPVLIEQGQNLRRRIEYGKEKELELLETFRNKVIIIIVFDQIILV